MATRTCFSSFCQPCTQANRTLFQLQPQSITSASTLLICSNKANYRSLFLGARVHQNAETSSINLSNSSPRGIVATLAPDRSTTPLPDRAEESIGSLKANREASSAGREESLAERVNGAAKSTAKYYGVTEVTKSLPMGLSGEREHERVSVKDYLDRAQDFIRSDGGPPRWFCPLECGSPPKDAPLLLFLPGMDGIGLGLILHHQTLSELFEVRCLHIPIMDRTPFEGLVKYVEQTIKSEHKVSPMKPIYLVGDSLGGCLALAVAARNPTIDLLLILCNPATSFNKSQLQPILPLLEVMPAEFHITVPYLLSFIMGDPIRMAMANVNDELSLFEAAPELSKSLEALLPRLATLSDIVPKDTLLWKLKLLRSAALYTNSRLHAVKAEILLLASGKDRMLPSSVEAKHLLKVLPNCRVRYFKDSGHTLLLEGNINLTTLIKGTNFYRRSNNRDYVLDYVSPTPKEFKEVYDRQFGWFRLATSPVTFSTLQDGKIVKGLNGIPQDGPVLLVGYHMLMGLELTPLVGEIIRERNILVRGIAHPALFGKRSDEGLQEPNFIDSVRLFGAVPVSGKNFFRLLSTRSFALLYPGGAREALHRKGEQYKLFWPERSEFVRMAARFGATIVPFAVVGEDDIAELLLDYDDLIKIPYMRDWIEQLNRDVPNLRSDTPGEISNQNLYIPGVAPKIPGRLYYLFGKPIATAGRKNELQDKEKAHSLYLHIKAEVETAMTYLQEKRKEDPYRQILPRVLYEATWGFKRQAPTFEP